MAAPAVEATVLTSLCSVILSARKAVECIGRDPERVRVVAVSKTKPVSLLHQVYDAGHRCFGENYVQEIIDKAPQTLSNCRADVCKALGMAEDQFELSMGISGDFEQAIEMGSTNVRVGSTFFGPREYPQKAAGCQKTDCIT